MKSDQLDLPQEMTKKFEGKRVELIETVEGILLKPLEDPIKETRGSLKGSRFSSQKYVEYKTKEKGLER